MVELVPQIYLCKYGIADLVVLKLTPGESGKIHNMVEKPDVDDVPSNLRMVGHFVLSGEILGGPEFTPPSAGDEVELKVAIASII
jgi:UTP--glucose-1-phosphate uridylyltransferase